MEPGQLLLLTGSPGSGKTTVAPLVADLRPRSACLDLDWFFAKLRSGAMAPWAPEAHEQNRVVLGAAAAALAAFVAGGYDTVGEGIIYPFMVDLFADACEPLGITVHYAVLRAPVAVVQQRVQGRRSEPEHVGALADPAVVGDLWHQFELHGIAERHRVDVATRSPADIAAEIDQRARAGDFVH
jgi:broad-specificity NMP kinase